MGHGKLKKFEENLGFSCLLQPQTADVLEIGGGQGLSLKSHPIKGEWNRRMFAAPGPIVVELGCGRGEYTVDLAERNPGCNYIGVDIKGARLWKGAKEATERQMGNVAFLRCRIEFIEAFFAPGEVDELWLTFSDPQLRGENKRLTSPLFLERYRKFLAPGGVVHLKTDSRFLYEYTRAVVGANGLRSLAATEDLYSTPRESLFAAGASSVVGPDAADAIYEVQTYYEKMFLQQGYKITYQAFTLDGHEGPFVRPDFDADYWRSVEGPRKFLRQS